MGAFLPCHQSKFKRKPPRLNEGHYRPVKFPALGGIQVRAGWTDGETLEAWGRGGFIIHNLHITTRWSGMARERRTTYALEGRSWTGARIVLLHFRTRLEMTGSFLRRVIKQLGGTSIRRIYRG
jgi:hypothetical protein